MSAKSKLPNKPKPKRIIQLGREYIVKLSAGRAVISPRPATTAPAPARKLVVA